MLERDRDRVAHRDGGCVADHSRAIAVPAHSIAPGEDPEWAEALQLGGDRSELRLPRVTTAGDGRGEPAFTGHEPCAHASETPPQVECFEREPQPLIPPLTLRETRAHRALELVRELRD